MEQRVGGVGVGSLGKSPLGTGQGLISYSVMFTLNEHLLNTDYVQVRYRMLGC